MTVVQEGVANFRTFQLLITKQMGQVRGLAIAWSFILTIAFLLAGWALNQIVPAAKLILDDYYRAHPASQFKQQNDSTPTVSQWKQQVTKIPTL